ncbi:Branched-chain amino acid transport protein (AzlD) [compost metagenome]
MLTAIVITQVLKGSTGAGLQIDFGNERIYAWLLACGVAWTTKNVVATLGAGMAALWILRALGI